VDLVKRFLIRDEALDVDHRGSVERIDCADTNESAPNKNRKRLDRNYPVNMSFNPAIVNTTANKRLIITGENFLLPKYEPAVPQTSTLTINDQAKGGKYLVALRFPDRPETELTKMNSAETADAVFVLAHPINMTSGVKKIPPPVPVKPAKSPNPAPTPYEMGFDGARGCGFSFGSSKNFTADNSKMIPTRILKKEVGRLRYPPIKAKGIDRMAKGQKKLQEKCPALQNCHVPTQATVMFNTKAIGLISEGAMLNSAITAI
jgi:hypothetical protein